MIFNTNTWALSPKSIALRLFILIGMGVILIYWIDYLFEVQAAIHKNPAVVHQQLLKLDSLTNHSWNLHEIGIP